MENKIAGAARSRLVLMALKATQVNNPVGRDNN